MSEEPYEEPHWIDRVFWLIVVIAAVRWIESVLGYAFDLGWRVNDNNIWLAPLIILAAVPARFCAKVARNYIDSL